MQIVYHLGAHCTDDERLVRCLLKNRAALAAEGIVVPGPARYRNLLRDTAMQLRGGTPAAEAQAALLDQIIDGDGAERLILSWENFLGYEPAAVGAGRYPAGPERMAAFAGVFPDAGVELFLAIRNPATFLPALAPRIAARKPGAVLPDADPRRLRWSDLAKGLRAALPAAPLTVWCDEDTPLIWPEVLAAVAGHSPALTLADSDDLLAAIMGAEGTARLADHLARNPPPDVAARRRIVATFLGRYALPGAMESEFEFPGWDAATVAEASAEYDRDVERLRQIEGVRFLAP